MKVLLHIFFIMLLSAMGACGPTDKAQDDRDSTTLRLGVLPTIECLPFYYADSTGMLSTLDTPVELVTFSAAMDADTAFWGGSIDGIVTDIVKVCLWESQNRPTQMVMGGDLRLWLVTAANARLLKTESMKEKIIAATRHSSTDYFTDRIVESANLKPLDINKAQINDIFLRMQMLNQNQYDAAILPEPYASIAVAQGAKRLTGTEELKMENMMCVVFRDSVAKRRKDDIDKLRDIYDQAVSALNAAKTPIHLGFLPEEYLINQPDSLFTYKPLKPSTLPSDSMITSARQWTTTISNTH